MANEIKTMKNFIVKFIWMAQLAGGRLLIGAYSVHIHNFAFDLHLMIVFSISRSEVTLLLRFHTVRFVSGTAPAIANHAAIGLLCWSSPLRFMYGKKRKRRCSFGAKNIV